MNPLKILGLSAGDTLETAKKRRNALLLKHHPDKCNGTREMYDRIAKAYEILVSNPEILKPSYFSPSTEFIVTGIHVTLEDFYFRRIKKITYTRSVFCRSCRGTGSSEGVQGLCSVCSGSGRAGNDILSLMGDSKCPFCGGAGIKAGKTCQVCSGSRYERETKSISFRLSVDDHRRRTVVINGVGNQLGHEEFGKLVINLDIEPCEGVVIEEDYFCVYAKVHPVQRIVGDRGEVEIFGRKVGFDIERGSSDAYATDRVSRGNCQCVRVKYVDIKPALNLDTEPLYRKILELEGGHQK